MRKRKKDMRILETFSLRLTLFRIWFIKNLYLFITVGSVSILLLIALGVGDNIPFIGMLFVDMRYWNIENTFVQNMLGTVGGLVAPITASAYVIRKTKHLTLQDIKSNKTKKAMLRANLYFNEYGKLTKRENNKKIIVKNTHNEKTGFFSDVLALAKELKLAMTAQVERPDIVSVENQDVGLKNLQNSLNNNTIVETLSNVDVDPIHVIEETESAVVSHKPRSMVKELHNEIKDVKVVVTPQQEKKISKNILKIMFGWTIILFIKIITTFGRIKDNMKKSRVKKLQEKAVKKAKKLQGKAVKKAKCLQEKAVKKAKCLQEKAVKKAKKLQGKAVKQKTKKTKVKKSKKNNNVTTEPVITSIANRKTKPVENTPASQPVVPQTRSLSRSSQPANTTNASEAPRRRRI